MDTEMGEDQLPAPQEGDEPISPGMGRVGPTPACGLCSGECSSTGILHPPPSSSGKGNPLSNGGSSGAVTPAVPIPHPRGMQSSPQITQPGLALGLHRAVLWGTGVLAAPGGLSTFSVPPRSARLSLSLLPLVGKFDLSPLVVSARGADGIQGTRAGTLEKSI